MDAKKLYIIFGITIISVFALGAVTGYHFNANVRSAEITGLAKEYNDAKQERDATISRITENNKLLRAGIERAEFELNEASARVKRLEEYIGGASIGNKQVITAIDGAGQNIEEASRIIRSYLNTKQEFENSIDSRDSSSGSGRSDNNTDIN